MKPLMAVGVGVLLLALLVGGCAFQGYNQAITLDEAVKNQWAQVENQLQRRYDLIPNMVATVKGDTEQEKAVFLGIAEAQKSYFQYQHATTTAERAESANQVEGALSRLLVLQQQYPQLRSTELFLKLQDTLEGTENRVSVERRNYNDVVQTLNSWARRFPNTLWASLAGVKEASYFKIDEAAKTVPKVDFSDKEKG
jgi:LemA protein